MGTLEDIKNMQKQGKSETEIINSLKAQGKSDKEISTAISQAKIKEAVSKDDTDYPMQQKASIEAPSPASETSTPASETSTPASETSTPASEKSAKSPIIQESQETETQMQPSMSALPEKKDQLQKKEVEVFPDESTPPQPQQKAPQEYNQQQEQNVFPQPPISSYPSQQIPQTSGIMLSTETISEIAEQTMTEKLSPIKNALEKVIDFRTTIESKIEYINERLKKLENIMDRLQLSILQKVGEYVTNTEDIKKEIQETQKSFKTLLKDKEKK